MAAVFPANRERILCEAVNHGDFEFAVLRFHATESLSQAFEIVIDVVSEDSAIKIDGLIGKPYSIALLNEDEDIERYFHGICYESAYLRHGEKYTTYQLKLVPSISLLAWRQNSRIFQQKTVPQIIQQVFEEAGITAKYYRMVLQSNYAVRDYVVQYNETELDFVQRLMAAEGLFYYFEHYADKHTIIVADGPACHQDIVDPVVPFRQPDGLVAAQSVFERIDYGEQIRPSKAARRDFDFLKPNLNLHKEVKDPQSRLNLEIYNYPGGYTDPDRGQQHTQHQWEAQQADRRQIHASGNCHRLIPGYRFSLEDHPNDPLNRGYTLVRVEHQAEQPQVLQETAGGQGSLYHNECIAIPDNIAFRTPAKAKPKMPGVHLAIVTGPKGEEIYTNEHAQIKVQFPWDREGRYDQNSSCWIRVSQPYAGAGWGGQFIPRVGTEVMIRHMNGDPDQPICIGQLYNGENRPPYKLPDHKTRSTVKTNSSLGGKGYNELRFEDLKGKEQIYIHAEKDKDIRVKNESREWIGRNRHLIVQNNQIEHVQGDKHLTVDGDHIERNDGTYSCTAGERFEKTGGRWAHEAGQEIHFKAPKIVLDGGSSLSVKASGSFITLDASGVTIKGAQIKINEGGGAGAGSGSNPQPPLQALAAVQDKPAAKIKQSPKLVEQYQPEPPTVHLATTPINEHWIEVQLTDADGAILANEALLIVLPNGISRKARTSGQGIVRLERIAAGQCEILLENHNELLPGGATPGKPLSGPDVKQKQISRLRWLQDSVPVGEQAPLEFFYQGFAGGETAIINIYEHDADGQHDLVDTVTALLEQKTGVCLAEWTVNKEKIEDVLREENESGETGCIEFLFLVTISGIKSEESLRMLKLTTTVEYMPKLKDGSALPDDTQVHLLSADKVQHQTVITDGIAIFENVAVGPIKISIDGGEFI